jgi:hypothetical protein
MLWPTLMRSVPLTPGSRALVSSAETHETGKPDRKPITHPADELALAEAERC